MESFDVIIIGAGPAGLKCAEILGNSNKKVLLLEKNLKIGPKPCGGLMTQNGMIYLRQDIGGEKFNNFFMNSASKKNKINISKTPLYTINREKLGQFQLKKVNKFQNITIRKESRVEKIEKNYVIVNKKKIKFDYLVGADGSSSIVRRYLGVKTNKLGIAFHYVIPTNKYKNIELFFDTRLFGPWYAWILPHKNYVSIGTGCDPKIMPTKILIDNFHKWLKQENINISKAKYEAHSLNYDYQGIDFGNIFLVGDAAGLIYSFTGEGIHPAMISSEEVGKKILNPGYNISIDEILKKKKSQDRITNFLIKFGFSRKILHELIILMVKRKIFKNKILKILT
ncbi:MAG: FAD-dependent monooxygenase [Bacteroidota bacterium]